MRKLILQEYVSLDGYAADKDGSTEFFENLTGEFGRDIDQDMLEFSRSIDTIILGANTYKMFVDFWPEVTTDEQIMADVLNETPKIVFSKTINEAPWGKWKEAELIKTDASEHIRNLKNLAGRDMVLWGSISLAQSLLKENLIDDVQLFVCPVVLGSGLRLFREDSEDLKMELRSIKNYRSGVVFLSYKVGK